MPKTHIFERELWGDGLWETANIGTRAIKTDWGLITVLHSVRAHLKRCNLKAHCLLPTQRCARRKNCWSLVHLKSPVCVLLRNSLQNLMKYYAMKMLGSFRIASNWSASNWKNRAGIDGTFPDICFFNSPEVGSLHFVTLTFLKRTSNFLTCFLTLFIFCPAKLPLLHACLAIQDLYKPRTGLGKRMSPSATER